MPTGLQTFEDDPLPETAVVDSSFVFEALIDPLQGDGRHQRCGAFAERLREGSVRLIISPLILLEAPQCWRRLHRKGALRVPDRPGDERDRVGRAFQEASLFLTSFLGSFDRWEIALSDDLLGLAALHAGRYDLRSHDALVVALSSTTGVYDVVTVDEDFEKVPHLTVWRE